jgi:hypothetical protein
MVAKRALICKVIKTGSTIQPEMSRGIKKFRGYIRTLVNYNNKIQKPGF